MKSFGEQLLHFAQSVDFLTEGNLDGVREMVFAYLKNKVGAAMVEVCVEKPFRDSVGEDSPGLDYVWCSAAKQPPAHPLRRPNNEYFGQTSYAYCRGLHLWIVGKNRDVLCKEKTYDNLWAEGNDAGAGIPAFDPYSGNTKIRTSIILPLIKSTDESGKCWGVFNVEFERVVKRYERLEEELRDIRDAIQICIELEAASRASRKNTRTAIARLNEVARSTVAFDSPRVFVAHAMRHDREVVAAIKEVLNDLFSEDQVVFWDTINSTGNISAQLVREITCSTYGICYLSEARGNGEYVDNPNVLFEAGMLHAMTNGPSMQPVRWIPIREAAEKIPFDFAQERMIVVDREGGRFKETAFKMTLQKMIKAMIQLNGDRERW